MTPTPAEGAAAVPSSTAGIPSLEGGRVVPADRHQGAEAEATATTTTSTTTMTQDAPSLLPQSCGTSNASEDKKRTNATFATTATTTRTTKTQTMGVGSFVDQAFSGLERTLIGIGGGAEEGPGLPSLATPRHARHTSRHSAAQDEDDDDDDEEEDDDDDDDEAALSYYPLVPLLLSLVLPVMVLCQHARSCRLSYDGRPFDPPEEEFEMAAAQTAAAHRTARGQQGARRDSRTTAGPGAGSGGGTGSSSLGSLLQSLLVGHILRLILACLLVRYGPTLKRKIDDMVHWLSQSSIWNRVPTCLCNIPRGMRYWLLGEDCLREGCNDSSSAASATNLGGGGSYHHHRDHHHGTGSSASSSSGSSSKSDRSSHMPALKILAALTILALVVHPDGFTWFILAKLWDGLVYSLDVMVTILIMMRDGDIPSYAVTAGLLTLFVAVRSIRLAVLPPSSSGSSTAADHRTTTTSTKSYSKGRRKGRKGRGRQGGGGGGGGGSGRARIRSSHHSHTHSHSQHNQHHHHHHHLHQSDDNRNHHNRSNQSIKSSASTVSASSMEDQRISSAEDGGGSGTTGSRDRLASSDVSEPGPSSANNSDEAILELSDHEDDEEEDLEKSSRGGGSGGGALNAAAAVATDENTSKDGADDKGWKSSSSKGNGKGNHNGAATPSKSGRKKKRGKKGGSAQSADGPTSPKSKSSFSVNGPPRSPPTRGHGRKQQQQQQRGAPQCQGGKGAMTIPQLSPTVISSIRPVVTKEQYKPTPEAKNVYHVPAQAKPTPLFSPRPAAKASSKPTGAATTAGAPPAAAAAVGANPVRYPVPNYASSYLYSQCDRRYSPGKIELAAFLAQVGLVGTACADLLDDMADVDSLAKLSKGHLDAYGVAEDKQVAIAALLDARRRLQQEAKAAPITGKEEQLQQNPSETILPGQQPLTPPRVPLQSVVLPPPGLDPTLDEVASRTSTKHSAAVRPIGSEKLPIGSEKLHQDRSLLTMPPLQSDHSGGLLLRDPLGSDTTRARCLSGDEISAFSGASANDNLTIPTSNLSPLPRSLLDTEAVNDGEIAEEDRRIEADLQELGGQMVGSILDF